MSPLIVVPVTVLVYVLERILKGVDTPRSGVAAKTVVQIAEKARNTKARLNLLVMFIMMIILKNKLARNNFLLFI